MPFFTSDRERRLWIWTLIVVAAIYSTLGPAQVLVSGLRERNLLRFSFALLLLLIGVAIIWRWVKQPPGWREIGLWLAAAAVYTFAFFRVESLEERTHLIEYSLVAILIYQVLLERARQDRHVPYPAALAFGATVALGFLDESIQAILPRRVFDLVDVGFNTLAGFMAIIVSIALGWARGLRFRDLRNRLKAGDRESKLN
jgi:VanZ family protein